MLCFFAFAEKLADIDVYSITFILPYLYFMSIEDGYTESVYTYPSVLYFFVFFIKFVKQEKDWITVVFGLIPLLLFLIFSLFKKIGLGDIEFLSVLILFSITANISINKLYIGMLLAFIFAVLYSATKKKKKIPFIPFMSVGFLIGFLFVPF